MGPTLEMLHRLCPLHVVLDPDGVIVQTGPTVKKLDLGLETGSAFLKMMEVYRPRTVTSMQDLIEVSDRRLHLRAKVDNGVQFKGAFVPDGLGGGILDLSFGIFVKDAVATYGLTSMDFGANDLSVELLFLIEANSTAMQESRRLNKRLQTAMFAAEERALTDMLTGLSNRRAMELVQARLHRANQEYALMHLDLDYFKTINDTLGHAAGDAVLRSVAHRMQGQIRKEDTVARIGGDEFVIIFPNPMTNKRLGSLAERIIARIEEPVPFDGTDCKVSASIGITTCCDLKLHPDQVVEYADIALYEAKNAGRGRFAHYHYHRSTDAPPLHKNAS